MTDKLLGSGYILLLEDGYYRTAHPWASGRGKTPDMRKAKVYTTLGSLRGACTYHGFKNAEVLEVAVRIVNEFPV